MHVYIYKITWEQNFRYFYTWEGGQNQDEGGPATPWGGIISPFSPLTAPPAMEDKIHHLYFGAHYANDPTFGMNKEKSLKFPLLGM